MKNINKLLKIIFTIIILLTALNTAVLGAVNINNIKDNDTTVSGGTEIVNIGSYIFSGITSVGIVVSVVVIAIIGVKYMLGSVDEKAGYKKSMIPYLIGAFLLFGASAIAKAIVALVS